MAGGSTGSSPFQSTSANVAPREIGTNFAGSELFPTSDNDQAAMGLYEQALKTPTNPEAPKKSVNHLTDGLTDTFERFGINADLGATSGVVFDSSQMREAQRLSQARETISQLSQNSADTTKLQTPAFGQSSERSAELRDRKTREEALLRQIQILTAKKPKTNPPGRMEITNVATNQRIASPDLSLETLVRKVYSFVKREEKSARALQTARQAQLSARKAGAVGIDGGMDQSRRAELKRADIEAPHEKTSGE